MNNHISVVKLARNIAEHLDRVDIVPIGLRHQDVYLGGIKDSDEVGDVFLVVKPDTVEGMPRADRTYSITVFVGIDSTTVVPNPAKPDMDDTQMIKEFGAYEMLNDIVDKVTDVLIDNTDGAILTGITQEWGDNLPIQYCQLTLTYTTIHTFNCF